MSRRSPFFASALLVIVVASVASAAPPTSGERRLLLVVSRRSALTDVSIDELKKVVLGERILSGREVWIATPPRQGGELAALAKELLGTSNEDLEIERARRTESAAGTGVRLLDNASAVLSTARSFPNVLGLVRATSAEIDDSLVVVWTSARN